MEEHLIKRSLTYYLENKNDFVYKTYLRLVANAGSGFTPTSVFWNDTKVEIMPEVYGFKGNKEAGVYVEIEPNQTKAIVFNWESGEDKIFSEDNDYALYIRRQPGVKNYPARITLNIPEKLGYTLDLPYSLTEEGGLVYNTILSRDFISRIFWKNE